ncbi:MAG: DUF1573 domain-containing protein [Thermogemmata sp.]|nr:DUF1573 domain-containing protein [Thermogemmata sp.]
MLTVVRLGTVFFTFPLVVTTTVGMADEAGSLHCVQPVADKGDCKAGSLLTHIFELRNSGASPVLITRVESSCGCSRLLVSQREVPPGTTALLSLELATLTQPEGLQRWPVRVYYRDKAEDTKEKTLELLVCARIVREIEVQPTRLIISASGATAHTITIRDQRSRPLTIRRVTSVSPFVTTRVESTTPGHYRITVGIAEQTPEGEHDGSISLWTDDPAYTELRIPVFIWRRPARNVHLVPEEVTFHRVPGLLSSQIVQLRLHGDGAIHIAEAQSDHPAIEVKYPEGKHRISAVRISIPAGAELPATGAALIRLRLTEPQCETVVIPVRWASPVVKP